MSATSVTITKVDEGLIFNANFTGGTLTVEFEATVDKRHRVISSKEVMTDCNHGMIFERLHENVAAQTALRYDFGPSVDGIDSLVLIAESTPLNKFVYGQANGNDLFPMRFPVPICSCSEAKTNSVVMMDLGGGKAAPLKIGFPNDFTENLELLIPVIQKTIRTERYTADNIELRAFASCFWAGVACEVAAKACIVGCGTTGPLVPACWALCLLAEAACLAAVTESKEAAAAVWV